MAGEIVTTADSDIELLLPEEDVDNPELSIVIPALNEELTVGEFVDWCKQGLEAVGVAGEILIVDSSTDRTAEIALEHGARVLKTPRRGLGRAYIDAVPYIRGRYVLLGDADLTYDFREIGPFMERFREGYEFVMGSRWKGYIEPGAMPFLHQYVGTPVTTRILNLVHASRFSDIHCGMRGITREALERMNLQSQSWEYASEMVLKSVRMKLRTEEVPIRFLKDREGRLSNLKRGGFLEPWRAGWLNLRAMFVYGADFFLIKPGVAMLAVGLLLTLPLSSGPISIGPISFSLYWMLAGVTVGIIGLQSVYLGCLAQLINDLTGAARERWLRVFAYTRTTVLGVALGLAGLGLVLPLVIEYAQHSADFAPSAVIRHVAIIGFMLMIFGFMTFTFNLVLHAAAILSARERGNRLSVERTEGDR